MPILGIESPFSMEVHKFIEQTDTKLQEKSLIKNPFIGKCKIVHRGELLTWVVIIDPVYPPWIPLIGIISLGLVFVFFGNTIPWLYVPCSVLALSLFFWSREFYYIMLRLGLRKNKAKGRHRLLSKTKIIRRFFSF